MAIDYKKFEETALVKEPFEHLVIENFIDKKSLKTALKDFPEIRSDGSLPLGSLDCGWTRRIWCL